MGTQNKTQFWSTKLGYGGASCSLELYNMEIWNFWSDFYFSKTNCLKK